MKFFFMIICHRILCKEMIIIIMEVQELPGIVTISCTITYLCYHNRKLRLERGVI